MDSLKRAQCFKQTYTVQVFDQCGSVVRDIQYNRRHAQEESDLLITAHQYNHLGQLIQSIDPRLFAQHSAGETIKATFQQTTSLSGQALLTEHIDNGIQLQCYHAQGEILWSRDTRGTERSWDYDDLARPTAIWEQTPEQKAPQCQERFYYGDNTTVIAAKNAYRANLRGQLYQQDDTAGRRQYTAYNMNQQCSVETQQFLNPTEYLPNWTREPENNSLLEEQKYTSYYYYSALGDLEKHINPKGYQQILEYNSLGQLKKSFFIGPSNETPQALLVKAEYYVNGQLLDEKLANGLEIQRCYNSANLRLTQLKTLRKGDPLQDLHFYYDPVGNIIKIEDKSQALDFYANQKIVAESCYQYDALYQLIQATGREVAASSPENRFLAPVNISNNADKQQLSLYQRDYFYDKAGNIQKIQHQGRNRFSLIMQVDSNSNKSFPSNAKQTNFKKSFDANGNLLYLCSEQTQPFIWNNRNQLQQTILVARDGKLNDTESYLYNGQGQRQQKLHCWQAQQQRHSKRVRYLPQLEVHEAWQENLTGSQRKIKQQLDVVYLNAGTVSVRLLHWETGKPEAIENDQQRFSITNHLGSCQLELDQNGQVISFEEYYPYGGTAIWGCRNYVEASYKTIRYSGKERDNSGLYYYGARYYIPWLGRWLNPDPAGIHDGLNLFCSVKNNPINFLDIEGLEAAFFQNLPSGWKVQEFSKFRLYSRANNFDEKRELNIFSHGGGSYFEKNTTVPKDMTVNFYAAPGEALNRFMDIRTNLAPEEIVASKKKVIDYKLGALEANSTQHILDSLENHTGNTDLLVLKEGQQSSLSDALKLAKLSGYSQIHGNFCRVTFALPKWIPAPIRNLMKKHRMKSLEKQRARLEEASRQKRQELINQEAWARKRERASKARDAEF